jgi:hyperosmotically inducible protein
MIRMLLRLVVVVVVLGAIAVFALGYRWGDVRPATPVAVEKDPSIDVESARRAGAEIAEKVAEGASRAGKVVSESKLTAKIKSKMALDDTIDASDVNVDTAGTVVTLRGSVANRKTHQRVLQLARETADVTSVVDKLTVREDPQ